MKASPLSGKQSFRPLWLSGAPDSHAANFADCAFGDEMGYCGRVDYSADPKFLTQVENEIQIGFAFLGAAAVEDRKEYVAEALAEAWTAYYAAANLMLRAPGKKTALRSRLRHLREAIELAKIPDGLTSVGTPDASQSAPRRQVAVRRSRTDLPFGAIFH
jgi:hypothetical protein